MLTHTSDRMLSISKESSRLWQENLRLYHYSTAGSLRAASGATNMEAPSKGGKPNWGLIIKLMRLQRCKALDQAWQPFFREAGFNVELALAAALCMICS